MGRRIALVSCASKKIEFATSAEGLYSSDLFRKASRIANDKFDAWYILSAKHGLLRPDELIEPYDESLNRLPVEERLRWAKRVFEALRKLLGSDDHVYFFAGVRYREFLEGMLRKAGVETRTPAAGLSIGRQLQWLNVQLMEAGRLEHLERLYGSLRRLSEAGTTFCLLSEASGRTQWPSKGLYFFFEPNERRTFDEHTSRIVRVGTHGVSKGSRSTLWGRLRTHRGSSDGRGNHRGSIFRLHVGAALQASKKVASNPSWGVGQSAERSVREKEVEIEREVSAYLGKMVFICLSVSDEAGATSDRAYLERNCIGLLCGPTGPVDLPSEGWLGRFSPKEQIRYSGMWNVDHIFHKYDQRFLDVLDQYVDASLGKRRIPVAPIAPPNWTEDREPSATTAKQLSLLLDDS